MRVLGRVLGKVLEKVSERVFRNTCVRAFWKDLCEVVGEVVEELFCCEVFGKVFEEGLRECFWEGCWTYFCGGYWGSFLERIFTEVLGVVVGEVFRRGFVGRVFGEGCLGSVW